MSDEKTPGEGAELFIRDGDTFKKIADIKPIDLSQLIPPTSSEPYELSGLKPLGKFTITGRWDDGTYPCPMCGLRFTPTENVPAPSVNGIPICDACAIEHLTK